VKIYDIIIFSILFIYMSCKEIKKKLICIFPICGSASRIGNIPKFLLPLPNKNTLLKNHLDNISSKYKSIIITTPDYSSIIYNYLINFFEKRKFKIIITETKTMSETVLSVNFNKNKLYSLIMPDTYFETNIIDKMLNLYDKTGCDIILGIFKIREEQKGKLGQVLFDEDNNLIDVVDKNKDCNYEWAWGTIIWNNKFINYMDSSKSHIGYALMPSLKNGLKIKICKSNSNYYDCGTFSEYKDLINNLK
jgi:hypothetical protein